MTELPESWSRPDDIGRATVMAELRREVGDTHPLAETRRNAVDVRARCTRCKLTCFALRDGTFALVSLDWSGRSDGRWFPRIEVAPAEELPQLLAAHTHEHDGAGSRSTAVRGPR
jgi:hypothetical protein